MIQFEKFKIYFLKKRRKNGNNDVSSQIYFLLYNSQKKTQNKINIKKNKEKTQKQNTVTCLLIHYSLQYIFKTFLACSCTYLLLQLLQYMFYFVHTVSKILVSLLKTVKLQKQYHNSLENCMILQFWWKFDLVYPTLN